MAKTQQFAEYRVQDELVKNTTQSKVSWKKMLSVSGLMAAKFPVALDIQMLDMIIAFLLKDSTLRTRKSISNIDKLMGIIDPDVYEGNPELESRIHIIQNITTCLLEERFEEPSFIQVYCRDHAEDEYSKELIDKMNTLTIKYAESKYMIKKVDSILEFSYVITARSIMQQILDSIDPTDFASYEKVANDLNTIAQTIVNINRKCRSLDADQTFSLDTDRFESVIADAVAKLKDRNRIFITGSTYLNALLSPGYMSKRLYTYLAFPGKGKSTILLKSALDMRKYNPNFKPKDPEKRPAILFLTLENDIPETIERMFNMTVSAEDIRNYTPNQVIKYMRDRGGLKLTGDCSIDIIIKEYKNREINTDDIYSIINDLADEGIEVCALILDYMKRIRPTEYAENEKGELKNISNELKEIAKFFDIPVITAQQLNREGAAVVDAALQLNKEDVTRLVGSQNIAGAWEIQENSDWTCIINPQRKKDTGELFMVFKLLKRRYRSSETTEKMRQLDYFNQPFEEGNEIKLKDDIDLDEPLGLLSLSTEFGPENQPNKRGNTNAIKREVVKRYPTQQFNDDSEVRDTFFDIGKHDHTKKDKDKERETAEV